MAGGMRGTTEQASVNLIAPSDESAPTYLRVGLGSFSLGLEAASRLADELEADEAFALWVLWEPSPGDRARFVEMIRKHVRRLEAINRERAAAVAAKQTATPGPPRG